MIGIGSMMRLVFTDYPIMSRRDRDLHESGIKIQKKFYQELLVNKRIFVNKNGIMFLSTENSSEIVDKFISSIVDSTLLLKAWKLSVDNIMSD